MTRDKVFNRRTVLQTVPLLGFIGMLPKVVAAQVEQPVATGSDILILEDISNNHGHHAGLSPSFVLQALRETRTSGDKIIGIQGASSHPHALALSHADLLQLFLDGSISIRSSVDAGHGHTVTLHLVGAVEA